MSRCACSQAFKEAFGRRLRFEWLESRRVLDATFYVDDDWVGVALGADPDGPGPAVEFGVDSFATIQGAIDAAADGDTIEVAAGIYDENVVVDKALSLLGPNATIDPVANPADRVAEAIISPSSGDAVTTKLFNAEAVTIKGFKIDSGSNGGGIVPHLAIVMEQFFEQGGYGNFDIQNNIVVNADAVAMNLSRAASVIVNQNVIRSNGVGIQAIEAEHLIGFFPGVDGNVTIQGNDIQAELHGVELNRVTGSVQLGGASAGAGNIMQSFAGGYEAFYGTSIGGGLTAQRNEIHAGSTAIGLIVGSGPVFIGGPAGAGNKLIARAGLSLSFLDGELIFQGNEVQADVGGLSISGVTGAVTIGGPTADLANQITTGAGSNGIVVSAGGALTIQGNEVTAGLRGLWGNTGGELVIGGASPGQGNIITAAIGIELGAGGGATIVGNEIVSSLAGIRLNSAGGPVRIGDFGAGNTITGDTGISAGSINGTFLAKSNNIQARVFGVRFNGVNGSVQIGGFAAGEGNTIVADAESGIAIHVGGLQSSFMLLGNDIQGGERGVYFPSNMTNAIVIGSPGAGNTIGATDGISNIGGGTLTGPFIIQANTIEANYGVYLINANGPTTIGGAETGEGNTIHAGFRAVHYASNGSVLIQGNELQATSEGIWLFATSAQIGGTAAGAGNTITGNHSSGSFGILLVRSPAVIEQNPAIQGFETGILVGVNTTISGNHIYDNNIGVLFTSDTSFSASGTVDNNSFEGGDSPDNGTDLRIDSAAAGITGGMLTGNTFAGATYIDKRDAQDIAALRTPIGTNTYKRDNDTVETFDANIEERIFHHVDDPSVGMVNFAVPHLPGDYNYSGIVDAADYVLWRKTLGMTVVAPLADADGNGNGVVDQFDYAIWRANFGAELIPAGAGAKAESVAGVSDADATMPLILAHARTTASDSRRVNLTVNSTPADTHDDALLAWFTSLSARAGDGAHPQTPLWSSESPDHETIGAALEAVVGKLLPVDK